MKPVSAVVELGSNYVFHLLACARVGFDSEYADRYHGALAPADLAWLCDHKSLLAFGNGHGGDLVGPLIFMPAYLNLDNENALGKFFALLTDGLRLGDFTPLLNEYQTPLKALETWGFHQIDRWLASLEPHREAIETFAGIYERGFGTYVASVWPAELPRIQAVAHHLNGFLSGRDLIALWENATGLTFLSDSYSIVLVSAIQNGPNANSLSYDRNVFYSGSDFGWMCNFINHEVGTHILIDLYRKALSEGRWPFDLCYKAYENLARFYNGRILQKAHLYTMPPQYDHERFGEIFSDLLADTPDLTPEQLYQGGMDRYSSGPRFPHPPSP